MILTRSLHLTGTKTRLLSAPFLLGTLTPLQTEPSDKRCSAGSFGCCYSQVCKKDPGSTQDCLLQGSLTWVLVDTEEPLF